MASAHERFWESGSFAFVGDSAGRGFPTLSYRELRKQGKPVFAVDPTAGEVEGDRAYPDFASLPRRVDAAVLEVRAEDTAQWIRRAADAGVRRVWIHMGRETPEALDVARECGVEALTGTCAVMYVKPGFSYHTLHKWVQQLQGRY